MNESELTEKIIGFCIKIHKELGPGLFESLYEEVLCYELQKAAISFKRQTLIPVKYEELLVENGFRADIVVEDKILLELKSVENLSPVHFKQVLTYLKLSGLKIGLLLNFNTAFLKDGIQRIVLGH
ncbi:MAG: GxxExxY protein [Spirochaetes bacterium GWF1_51_8]|nr:MAG: GxxExxY protein [Spirochaetes bacterium GWF1_51_8]